MQDAPPTTAQPRSGRLGAAELALLTLQLSTLVQAGLPLEEAARMASTYPAEFLGIGDRYGRIAPGYQADLVALDEQLQVVETWIQGKTQA